MRLVTWCGLLLAGVWGVLAAAGPTGLVGFSHAVGAEPRPKVDGNRLAYLDESDPFYVSRSFPKLTTPQWIGEPEVQAAVILSIDDMKGHEKWEAYLRPILERLKRIDGRAPLSIMTCQIDPRQPHLQKWLREGVSLETHTYDHPCPLLKDGDLAKAKLTYDRCVEQMNAVPGNKAVAFRVPCCDSQNTPSPRYFSEIFNRRTHGGQFLQIDSSVFNLTTANDPELPRNLVLDNESREIFRRYLPFKSYVATVEDYPYPYVIGRLCWEFPCVVPSDWSAQHVQKPDNPQTVEDLKRALDAAVIKQGVFTLVFHPHKWLQPEQLVELIDYAVVKHGPKVKFLSFREAAERLNHNLLVDQPLRATDGSDNGVRVMDVDRDGYLDVVIGNKEVRKTRIWSPKEGVWREDSFPLALVDGPSPAPRDLGIHFGVVRPDGYPTVLVSRDQQRTAWHFDGQRWFEDPDFVDGLYLNEAPLMASRVGLDQGLRFRDVDADGICELIVGNPRQRAVFRHDGSEGWRQLDYALPAALAIVDGRGHDAGLRFVDIDLDGRDDLLSSNDTGFAAYLFTSPTEGWSQQLVSGKPGDQGAIPQIVRQGANNGAWIHSRTLWVQNEHTDKLPDLVDRKKLDDLLLSVPFPGPKSPEQSRRVTYARPGFQVDIAAAEPLVTDPVAMAWGPDGRLWVVEMGDYPRGEDGKGKHGGKVHTLEDVDGDGIYDKSTMFLDDLGFPNGVIPWRNGVIITCAPDVIYAEDTNGDGVADRREVLYSGFLQGNPQHRVNGFKWGMDGWLYGAHADAVGGKIRLHKRNEIVNANGRDFRIRPDEGLLDPQSGVSQFGRNRDDWDNWFGNENSNPMYHYVLADHYLRRNSHVPAADGKVDVADQAGVAEVFPRSRTIARYNDLYAANRFTSANSTIVYRDDLFGPAYEGNAFVSEPVHNLVHREIMRPEGLTFHSRRADDERDSEFLASADNWFRPAMLATGPDGALWVADMYRQTIEHPEWIPQTVQKQIDLRAGSDMGRIYRVYPIGVTPRKIPRLDKLSTVELVAALDTPSGWQRDMIQQMLIWKADPASIEPLRMLASKCKRPIARAQALWTLELLGKSDLDQLAKAMKDPHPGVRRHAVQIGEAHLGKNRALDDGVLALAKDADLQVQLQRAYTLGAWLDPRAGAALGDVALRYEENPYMTAAVLSSVTPDNLNGMVAAVLAVKPPRQPPAELLEQLVALASDYKDEKTLGLALQKIGEPREGSYAAWQLTALAGLLDALDRQEIAWQKYDPSKALAKMFTFARTVVADDKSPDDQRLRAVRLMGRSADQREADIASLVALLVPQTPGVVQVGVVETLGRLDNDQVPAAFVTGWRTYGPALRSQVLDVLLSRPEWTLALLKAVEANQVPAADIDATRRQRMLRSSDPATKELAARLLSGAIESNRQQVLEQHAAVLTTPGDVQAGAQVFTKRCSVCHKLRGAGHEVGPNLASLTDYSPQALLTAILDPNRAVEAKFLDYLAITTTGLSHTGMLANETGNSVTLMGQEGKQQTILRNELEALQATGKSLMPEGLEKDLSPIDLANVIAYLRGSGAPRKQFEANQPALVKPTTDGTLQLYPTNCEIYGTTIVMEQLYKNLGKWKSENDRVVWNVELPAPGRYSMVMNYACLDADAGNTWILEAGDRALTGKVASTGSLDRYQEIPCGEIDLPSGPQQIIFHSQGPPKGNLLQLGGILLKPKK